MGFVPTPKVANRSMKVAIASHINMPMTTDVHHLPWKFTPLALLRDNDYFRFGFVRNPLDRLLSCYAQKIVYYQRELGMAPLLCVMALPKNLSCRHDIRGIRQGGFGYPRSHL